MREDFEATLCAIFSELERRGLLLEVLQSADWIESGVQFALIEKWWINHKAADARRRLRAKQLADEERERELAELRRLSKKYGQKYSRPDP